MFKNKPKLLIKVLGSLIVIVILLIVIILYYPLFNLKQTVKYPSSNYLPDINYVLKDYNPLYPRVTVITTLDKNEGYYITVMNLKRTGIFTYEPDFNSLSDKAKSGIGVDVAIFDKNKSLEEVIKLSQEKDFSKESYEKPKTQEQIEREEESKKSLICQRLLDQENKNRKLSDLNVLYKNMLFQEYREKIGDKGNRYLNNNQTINFEIRIEEPKEIVKVILELDKDPLETDSKILSLKSVDKDCNVQQITLPEKS